MQLVPTHVALGWQALVQVATKIYKNAFSKQFKNVTLHSKHNLFKLSNQQNSFKQHTINIPN